MTEQGGQEPGTWRLPSFTGFDLIIFFIVSIIMPFSVSTCMYLHLILHRQGQRIEQLLLELAKEEGEASKKRARTVRRKEEEEEEEEEGQQQQQPTQVQIILQPTF